MIEEWVGHECFTWVGLPLPGGCGYCWSGSSSSTRSNGAVSIAVNLGLMRLLVGEAKWNYVASNVLAIVVCSLANFLLGERFVFDAEKAATAMSR